VRRGKKERVGEGEREVVVRPQRETGKEKEIFTHSIENCNENKFFEKQRRGPPSLKTPPG
jgi:hypothetical protein